MILSEHVSPLLTPTDSKHEDGTQSDSENALGEQRRAAALDERAWGLWGGAGTKFREGRANVPEGLFAEEESPARRRKSSSSKVPCGFGEKHHAATHQQTSDEGYRHGDDYSDRGTYTIELENGDHEEEEARKMIEKVRRNKLPVTNQPDGIIIILYYWCFFSGFRCG